VIILLHSSKTMRRTGSGGMALREPALLDKARVLADYLKSLTAGQLAKTMHLSASLAGKTHALIAEWTDAPQEQSPAVDSFVGDIYSGLHANDLTPSERDELDLRLYILSGLYGVLRPYDGIYPYRLEMGYKLPDPRFASLYDYWGESIAEALPKAGPIVNLAADEYSRTVTRYLDASRFIAPKFLTVNPKTGQPSFVVVHAKIARGAFARWLVTSRASDPTDLEQFAEIGYQYAADMSTPDAPTFVCETFEGKGLSIRGQ